MRSTIPGLSALSALCIAACTQAPPPEPADTPAPGLPPPEMSEAAAETGPRVMHYDCEGNPVMATYDGHGQVSVAVDGLTLVLANTDQPSDDQYADAEGNTLRARGESSVLLSRAGHPDRACTGLPADPV